MFWYKIGQVTLVFSSFKKFIFLDIFSSISDFSLSIAWTKRWNCSINGILEISLGRIHNFFLIESSQSWSLCLCVYRAIPFEAFIKFISINWFILGIYFALLISNKVMPTRLFPIIAPLLFFFNNFLPPFIYYFTK